MSQKSNKADVFAAVADPTRREILLMLASDERTVADISSEFQVTRSAISQQLKILLDASLVDVRIEGRNRYYTAVPNGLNEIVDWVSHFDSFWDVRLANLGKYLKSR